MAKKSKAAIKRQWSMYVMALMLTVAFATMLALMGLVFDGGRIYYEKRRLQAAADAGAFAAAQELRRGHRGPRRLPPEPRTGPRRSQPRSVT